MARISTEVRHAAGVGVDTARLWQRIQADPSVRSQVLVQRDHGPGQGCASAAIPRGIEQLLASPWGVPDRPRSVLISMFFMVSSLPV